MITSAFLVILTWATVSKAQTCQARCPADVVFLIDESSSVTPARFRNYVIPFIDYLSRGLQISPDGTHLGLIPYSDPEYTKTILHLCDSFDPAAISSVINNLNYAAGDSALYTALQLAAYDVFTAGVGARVSQWGQTVAAYAIIITDSVGTDDKYGDPADVAMALLERGIVLYAVGVGDSITADYLRRITRDQSRIYTVTTFSQLTVSLADQILSDTCCPINATKPPPDPPPKYCDQIDMALVLSESQSVRSSDFELLLKQFLIGLTKLFTINQYRNSRVAAIGYGWKSKIFFNLFDPYGQDDLFNKIYSMEYLGGARNTSAGFQTVLDEVLPYSRIGDPTDPSPFYLIHVTDYAHDAGDDPVPVASKLGQQGVIIFNVAVLPKFDQVFRQETENIVQAGAKGSMAFNASSYADLSNSGIFEQFLNILDDNWRCDTQTTPALSP